MLKTLQMAEKHTLLREAAQVLSQQPKDRTLSHLRARFGLPPCGYEAYDKVVGRENFVANSLVDVFSPLLSSKMRERWHAFSLLGEYLRIKTCDTNPPLSLTTCIKEALKTLISTPNAANQARVPYWVQKELDACVRLVGKFPARDAPLLLYHALFLAIVSGCYCSCPPSLPSANTRTFPRLSLDEVGIYKTWWKEAKNETPLFYSKLAQDDVDDAIYTANDIALATLPDYVYDCHVANASDKQKTKTAFATCSALVYPLNTRIHNFFYESLYIAQKEQMDEMAPRKKKRAASDICEEGDEQAIPLKKSNQIRPATTSQSPPPPSRSLATSSASLPSFVTDHVAITIPCNRHKRITFTSPAWPNLVKKWPYDFSSIVYKNAVERPVQIDALAHRLDLHEGWDVLHCNRAIQEEDGSVSLEYNRIGPPLLLHTAQEQDTPRGRLRVLPRESQPLCMSELTRKEKKRIPDVLVDAWVRTAVIAYLLQIGDHNTRNMLIVKNIDKDVSKQKQLVWIDVEESRVEEKGRKIKLPEDASPEEELCYILLPAKCNAELVKQAKHAIFHRRILDHVALLLKDNTVYERRLAQLLQALNH